MWNVKVKLSLGWKGVRGLSGPVLPAAAVRALGLGSCVCHLVPFPSSEWLLPPAPPVQLLAPLASGLPLAAATSSPRRAAFAHSSVPRPITSCYTHSVAHWAPSFREKPCGSGDLQAGFGPQKLSLLPLQRKEPRRPLPTEDGEKVCGLWHGRLCTKGSGFR